MSIAFTPEVLKARFAELNTLKEDAQDKLDEAIQKRDGIRKSATEAIERANQEYRTLEKELGMFEIQQELAIIVRALGGATDRPVVTQAQE
jgi:F0F1-type ATP synthase membrane subunit b/b'